jgi:hypothetical protein
MIKAMMLKDYEVSKENKAAIQDAFRYILELYLENREDLVYLDFDLKVSGDYFKIIANNILTALWLSGIIIDDPEEVLANNICYVEDRVYRFNEKTKVLTSKQIK